MGLGLPRVIVTEKDLSYFVDTLMKGISCVQGITEKGPVASPQLIGSWQQFNRVFGGEIKDSDFPLLCKRALDRGAVLWVSRVVHFTDIADKTTITAIAASVVLRDSHTSTPADTLKVTASSPGAWGNNLKVKIEPGTVDATNEFNLYVLANGNVVETFENISMTDTSDRYIEKILRSDYITVEDMNSSNAAPVDIPKQGTFSLAGGVDGISGITDADYIGDSASGTGVYAFDEVDDAMQLATPGITSTAVIAAGLAYCENRQDMVYICETPFDLSPQEAKEFRLGEGTYNHAPFVSNYGAMYYGKLRIYDVSQGKERYISPIGDVLGAIAYNDWQEDVWWAPAGIRRGRILNCLGVDVNTGTKGRMAEGSLLHNNQVNPICVFEDSGPVIWGEETLQRLPSALRDLHIRRLMIYIEKSIARVSRIDLFEPNDPIMWRRFYRRLVPFLEDIKSRRGLYDFRVECDQNAKSVEEAKLNTPERVDRGEFRCQVWVKPVRIAKWIMLDFNITKTDVKFDEVIAENG